MRKRYYLAYGSNLNVEQMHHRCPTARIIGTTTLKDYRLLFKGSKSGCYLTIEPCKGESVPCCVWEVQPYDEMCLDHYEGYPTFYYKKDFEITLEDLNDGENNQKCNAFAYIMHEDRPLGPPSEKYLNTCLKGYKSFGFNPKYLTEALIASIEEAL